jgi:pyrimidine-nucleoside phosphorylase
LSDLPSEIIKIKRDKKELAPQQIKKFVEDFVSGEVADYQMSAFLMAAFLNGLSKKETLALTEAMLRSGEIVDLSSIKGLKIDKHSTGGVGDKTSLIIGPIVASSGVKVPMISGRGLGHTGGTLDKLESIPGFSTQLSLGKFIEQIDRLGICFIGQTKEICPADKKMYALRDVTGTVESISLICASIMSKKLAEGIDGLVLDIKVGSGAFMKTPKEAKALALGLVGIAKSAKKKVSALITDMNQPLGRAVGNSLEVEECLDILKNRGPGDLRSLSIELSAEMIFMGGKAKNLKAARNLAEEILQSGKALRCFEEIVAAQGGRFPVPRASNSCAVLATKNGYISKMETEKIGTASLLLGAGRKRSEDKVDPSAGIILHFKIGEKVKKGNALATLYFNDEKPIEDVKKMLIDAIGISLQKTQRPRLIIQKIRSLPRRGN